MNSNRPSRRLMAIALSVVMVLGLAPASATAETLPLSPNGEIAAFSPLAEEISAQQVPTSTALSELAMPERLIVTVGGEQTDIAVTWQSAPEYDGSTAGEYIFIPELPEGYILSEGVEPPKITVMVGGTMLGAMAGTLAAEMPDYSWYDANKNAPRFEIGSAAQLQGLADIVNGNHGTAFDFTGREISLTSDLDLSGYESWTPIGPAGFGGTFKGNGHTISGLTIDAPAQSYAGLFGLLLGSVSDLSLLNVTITGGTNVGGIAGELWGSISRCAVVGGTVSGNQYTGGIAGKVNMGSLTSCFATCDIRGIGFSPYYAGGVTGRVEGGGSLSNCYATGSVRTGEGSSGIFGAAGGVVGSMNSGSIQRCFATGEVAGTIDTGGVVGAYSGGTLANVAALNSRVAGAPDASMYGGTKTGRVAGRSGGATNAIAFSGLILVNGGNGLNGTDKSSTEIKAEGFFEANGFSAPAWQNEIERLPVLTGFPVGLQNGELPVHIGSPTPTAPQAFTAQPNNGSVALSWAAPGSSGDSAISKYEVQKNNEGWISVAMATTYTFTGLTNGTTYAFEVRAVNSYGNGAAASVQRVPLSPGTMAAIPGDRSVTLTWVTPLGQDIRAYHVRCNGGSWTAADNNYSHTFVGLANGVDYAFDLQVFAWNGTTNIILFSASAAAMPVGKPMEPINLIAVPENGQIELSWGEVYSDGGSPVVRYEVSRDGGASWVSVGMVMTHIFTGLVNGKAYSLQVRAVNAIGAGSAAMVSATPRQPPAMISANSQSFPYASGGTFTVSASGTQPIAYALSGQPDGVNINEATGSVTVGKMVPAGVYPFTITAANGSLPDAVQNFTLTITSLTPQLSDLQYTAPSNRTYNGTSVGIGPVTDKNAVGLSCTVYYHGASGTIYPRSQTPPKNVGQYEVIAAIAGNTNINATELSLGTYRILPKSITVTPTAGQNKVYSQPDPSLQYTLSNALYTGDALSGTLARAAGENAGTYAIAIGTLTAGSNYALSLSGTVNFTISPKADAAFTIAEISPLAYTGSAITPEPEVKDGSAVLTKNVDFTYSYSSNTVAGASAAVNITGIGNYAGSTGSAIFSINKATPTLALTAAPAAVQTRPGSVDLFAALPADATGTLTFKAGADTIATVTLPMKTNSFTPIGAANSYSFTVEYSGDSNYEGKASAALKYGFTKSDQAALSTTDGTVKFGDTLDLSALVSGGSGTGAFGFAVTGGPANLDGATLTPTGVGTVNITATKAADHDYNVRSASITVTVNPRVITFTVAPVEPQAYTGSALTPEPEVKDGSTVLTKNVDFTYGYSSNTAAGVSAAVNITGIGNYAGSTGSTIFTINKAAPTLTLTATPAATQTRPGKVTLFAALPSDATGTLTFRAGTDTIATVTLPMKTTAFTPTGAANAYSFTVEYSGDSNYEGKTSAALEYGFTKSDQAALSTTDGTVDFGDPLDLSALVSGGSGTGAFSFAITGGSATLDSETLTPTGVGAVNIVATRAADDNYNAESANFVVTVNPRVITFTVAPVEPQTYTGSAITPKPEVKDEDALLIEGGDFTYDYSDNTAIGVSAVVNITGIGNYAGSNGSVTFAIGKATPNILTPPTVSNTIYAGTELSELPLTGGAASVSGRFEWRNPSAIAVRGPNTFEARFVPDDTANYLEVEGVSITFTASKRPYGGSLPFAASLNQPTAASAAAPAKVANGQATLSIPDSMVKTAIDKALADANAGDNIANGISVVISVTATGATDFILTLERNALNRLLNAGAKSFSVSGLPVNINFDTESLRQIRAQSGGDIVITARHLAVTGLRSAYDIAITSTKGRKVVSIASLGKGSTRLSISAAPGRNESGGYLYGVYVDTDNKINRIANSVYDAASNRVILSVSHFSVYGVGYSAPSAGFRDAAKHWAKDSIDYVVGRGLLSGTSKTTFSPDTAITRGMLATALGRLSGADVSGYKTSSFRDVKAGDMLHPYIEWACRKGIMKGAGNGQFVPDREVTREEIAVILQNYARATGYKLPTAHEAVIYTDSSTITCKDAVRAMQQAGVMMGGSDNRFNPKSSATRAEVSAMLHRYAKLTIDSSTAQGWAKNDDGQRMYYKNGAAVTGSTTIDGVKYYFSSTGVLQAG